jgi:enoyl-CoA hydratase/carnithine racemase
MHPTKLFYKTGKYRVATDSTLFAMPETAIGFFCDVGGSFFLPRLPGALGPYLALTGARLKGAANLHAGVATHYVPSDKLDELEEALVAIESPDQVAGVLDRFSQSRSKLPDPMAAQLPQIERCFGNKNSVEEIVSALEADKSEWAEKTLASMRTMSPTSLKVVFRQMKEGAKRNFTECFEMENLMAEEYMRRPDFFEGVRALLVDKDRKPAWNPSTLAGVTDEQVDKYFPN